MNVLSKNAHYFTGEKVT